MTSVDMTRKMTPEEYRERDKLFNVGDTVKIVSKPYNFCIFGFMGHMQELCGRSVTISSKRFTPSGSAYTIKEEKLSFNWCSGCFDDPEEITDTDFDIEQLYNFL